VIPVAFMADLSISRENVERLFTLNPETAAVDYEPFRKANESNNASVPVWLTPWDRMLQYHSPFKRTDP